MKPVRPPAEHSPARHRLALFRFFALIRPAAHQSADKRGDYASVLVLDRDQSSTECYLRGSLELVIGACYGFALMQKLLPELNPLSGAIAAAAISWTAANLVFFFLAVPCRLMQWLRLIHSSQRLQAQTAGLEILLALTAAWAISARGWIHWIGSFWLSLLALNFLAFCAISLLRERMRELEERLGGNEFVS